MNEEQDRQVEDIFAELLGCSGDRRRVVLDSVQDPEVRQELVSLLEHAEGESLHLNDAIGRVAQAALASGAAGLGLVAPGTRFGHYRITRRLGQGGMGEVYEAVRDDDFHMRVAIKIVRYGLESDFANRRFQQERQLLAGLEHPNIARLLDGGEAEMGRPYLVLEYVEGLPINRYCEGMPRDAVLRLFLKVCEAVEFAHRNLVIHRDLKPANILVTAAGEPKLLDFGIARLLNSVGDATQTGFSALTPQYASPEQVRGDAMTTASDVYSLGMVLYELLSGVKPYVVGSANPVEVNRLVCQTEVPRPGLSQDLDTILLMALRKDPARRYLSAREFADDLERSLTHRPVLARPDSAVYRVKKFVRRHWTGVAAGIALFLAVAGGVATTVYQARIAQQRFEQVRKLAHSFVFDYSDELAKLAGTTSVREKMVRTALEYLDNLSSSAGNDLEFQKELATAYQKVGDAQGHPTKPSLGHVDQAVDSYRKAAIIHERIMAREPAHRRERGAFYMDYAGLLRLTGHYADATKMGEVARDDLQRASVEHPADDAIQRDLAHTWCLLGDLEEDEGHTALALEKFRKCEEIAGGVLARSRSFESLSESQGALERIGTAASAAARFDEALAAFDADRKRLDEMIELQPANPGLHRSAALLGQFRASVYYDDGGPNLGDPRRCLVYSREYLDATRAMVARDPNDTSAQRSLATALFRESIPLKFIDPAAAVASAEESVRVFDALLAKGNRSYLILSRRGRAERRLSEALLVAGHTERARAAAEEALTAQRQAAARDKSNLQETSILSSTLVTAARAAEAQNDHAVALSYLTEADGISATSFTQEPGELVVLVPRSRVLEALSDYWLNAGDTSKAQLWRDKALSLWRQFPDQNDYVRRESARLSVPVQPRAHRGGEVARRTSVHSESASIAPNH